MKRLLRAIYVSLMLVMLSLTGLANTNPYTSPSDDHLPITPDTWREVDLAYTDKIDGQSYPGEIKLLRPKQWLKARGMDQAGSHVTLSIPEFGIHQIHAVVKAINPTTLDTSNIDWSKQRSRPVIGTFKRYASIVNTYMFKDRHGTITKIHATPNHPFYVKNKHTFIPIEHVSSTDQLVAKIGKSVHLVCPQHKPHYCGKRYSTHGKPTPVYNLEVYQQHVYYIGNNKILVHNNCDLEHNLLNSKIIYEKNINRLNIINMDETHIITRNSKNLEGIATTAISDCAAVAVCTKNKIILTHLIGSNPEHFDEFFLEGVSELSATELENAKVIIYSPSILKKQNNFVFDSSSPLEDEHFIVETIGETLKKHGLSDFHIKGLYHSGGSHGFGISFSDSNKILFGELDFNDPVIWGFHRNSSTTWDF